MISESSQTECNPGTPLASFTNVVTASEYQSVRDAHVMGGWWALYQKRLRLLAPAMLLVLGTLALAGLPGRRIAVLGGIALLRITWEGFQACRAFRLGASPRRLLVTLLGTMVPTVIAVALTGGLRSPLAVLLLGLPLSAVISLGRHRGTGILIVAWGLAVVALALEPAALAGPPLARAWATVVTVEALLSLVVFLRREILSMSDANLRAHQQLDRLREEGLVQVCERARSLQSIGAKVAHELKNPLAAIKGLVQLLHRAARDPRERERIGVISAEVEHMEAILRDYLSYSRPLEELRLQAIELGALAQDVVATLAGRAEASGVAVSLRGDATVNADRRRLKEALINLVQNAIEACDYGASVELEIRDAEGRAEVVIADTGHGIPAETLARVGTPFFTTRESGTGLGVVLARSVVVHHGGNLRFESTPGRGTRVTVQLPLEGARKASHAVG